MTKIIKGMLCHFTSHIYIHKYTSSEESWFKKILKKIKIKIVQYPFIKKIKIKIVQYPFMITSFVRLSKAEMEL